MEYIANISFAKNIAIIILSMYLNTIFGMLSKIFCFEIFQNLFSVPSFKSFSVFRGIVKKASDIISSVAMQNDVITITAIEIAVVRLIKNK
jgi:hypothetical protein